MTIIWRWVWASFVLEQVRKLGIDLDKTELIYSMKPGKAGLIRSTAVGTTCITLSILPPVYRNHTIYRNQHVATGMTYAVCGN